VGGLGLGAVSEWIPMDRGLKTPVCVGTQDRWVAQEWQTSSYWGRRQGGRKGRHEEWVTPEVLPQGGCRFGCWD
jgi:hypothetical protein